MNRITTVVLASLASSGLALGLAAPAHADTKSFGDCTLSASLSVVRGTSTFAGRTIAVTAHGSLSCTYRHPSVTITTYLKNNGSVFASQSVTASNWTGGGRDLTAGPIYSDQLRGCVSVQSVFLASISNLGSSYVTTGSPQTICP